jgi:hypothetical protein
MVSGQDFFTNLIPHLEAWWPVLVVIIALIGLVMTVSGLAKLTRRSQSGRRKAFMILLAGVLLLNAPEFLDVLTRTIFAQDAVGALSYRPPANVASGIIRLVVLVVAITGLIGVARGIHILSRSTEGGGGLSRALVHIVGGILCVNLPTFLRILAASLGGEVGSIVSAIVG